MTGFRDESQLFIGGKWVDASGGTYDVVNPATEEVVGTAPNATVADAERGRGGRREALPGVVGDASRRAGRRSWPVPPRPSRRGPSELLPLVIAETGATAAVGSTLQVPIAVSRFERYSLDLRPVAQRRHPSPGGGGHAARPRRPHQRAGAAPTGRAWWPASRRTTSRSSTWPARSPRRWPWATPS